MDTWMGVNHDPQTLHKYMYTHADPVNNTDPTGNYTLSGLSTAINIRGILTVASRTHAGMSWMDTIINSDPEDFDARAVGVSIIVSMLGGKLADKFLGVISKKYHSWKADKKSGKPGCENSFLAGTLVHTEFGLKPIEEIEIGDRVWGVDEKTGEKNLQKVVHLIQNQGNKDIVDLTLENGLRIYSTENHPFYLPSKKLWMDALHLKVLDDLQLINGETVKVEEINDYQLNGWVFNLSVENVHNYYVGAEGVLVHNCPEPGKFPLPQKLQNKMTAIEKKSKSGNPYDSVPGILTLKEVILLGTQFVGPNASIGVGRKGARTLKSADGLRLFTYPTKKNYKYTLTGYVANFETRNTPVGGYSSNIHVDVKMRKK